MSFGGADLHGHSTCSDGVRSPSCYAALAAEAGLSAAALTDHDAISGLGEFEGEASRRGLFPVPGVELSVASGADGVHLLGLFVDPAEPVLLESLVALRAERDRRGERIVDRLRALGMPLDLAAIRREVAGGALGRPHIARALLSAGYVSSLDEAFDGLLTRGKPGYVPKARWSLVEAIEAVRRAGGLAVLAHPIWYPETEALVSGAAAAGLDGLEAYHPDHDARAEARFVALARSHGLLVTAGSDFHGPPREADGLGRRRLGEGDWGALREAAVYRRREAGRPPIS